VPSLAATLDKASLSTELGKTEVVSLALTSHGNFAGTITLTAKVVDAQGLPLPGVTIQGPSMVALQPGGTIPAQFQVAVATDATGATVQGTVVVDYSSSLGNSSAMAPITVAAVYTFDYAAGTNNVTAMHVTTGKTVVVKRGTKLRFHNSDTATHITHGDGAFPHENTAGATSGDPGNTYEVATTQVAPGSTGKLGCHTHGSPTYATVNVR